MKHERECIITPPDRTNTDKNDCMVNAVRYAFKIPYDEAEKHITSFGPVGKGLLEYRLQAMGYPVIHQEMPRSPLDVIASLDPGAYIFGRWGHVYAVWIDESTAVIYNNKVENHYINRIWKIS